MVKNRIAELRRSEGMNQRELGEKLGVGQTTVSAWERGQNEPDRETLFKMAKLFNASIDYVLGYKEDSYRRGLSDSEYEKVEAERDERRFEAELERQEKKQGFTDEEIEEIILQDELDEWETKAGKPDTIEGYIVSKIIDNQSKKNRKLMLEVIQTMNKGFSR